MAERNEPIISFRDFSFQYRAQKRPTLTGIDLDIYPGERVLIAGPSGSGKSTLAGCINGLNPFSNPGVCTGTLTVDGAAAESLAQPETAADAAEAPADGTADPAAGEAEDAGQNDTAAAPADAAATAGA